MRGTAPIFQAPLAALKAAIVKRSFPECAEGRKHVPSHRLTWKCTEPCRETTFLLERGVVHFHVSWWEGKAWAYASNTCLHVRKTPSKARLPTQDSAQKPSVSSGLGHMWLSRSTFRLVIPTRTLRVDPKNRKNRNPVEGFRPLEVNNLVDS